LTVASVEAPVSQRERNKEDKFRRIRDASLELFLSKGFDDTTTREIAARAGVGLGTVFVYAKTKRDLLFLIVNGDLERVVEEARAAFRPDRSMLENLLTIIRLHYAIYAKQPELSRLTLREMYFYASGVQGQRFLRTRERLIQLFIDIVTEGMKQGAIQSQESPAFLAWMIFALFQVDIRRFLMQEDLSIDAAVKTFARQLRVLMRGLSAKPGAFAVGRTSRKK